MPFFHIYYKNKSKNKVAFILESVPTTIPNDINNNTDSNELTDLVTDGPANEKKFD